MSLGVAPERRRHIRFRVLGNLSGQVVDWGAPFPVRDVSLGGFAIASPIPLDPGVEHRVRFQAPDNWSVTLAARVVNCHPVATGGDAPQFVAGFAFTGDTAGQSADAARVRQSLSNWRYLPRLMLRPWDASWLEAREIAAQSQLPGRALIEHLATIAPSAPSR